MPFVIVDFCYKEVPEAALKTLVKFTVLEVKAVLVRWPGGGTSW
jgi:hypothetical protein